MSLYARSNWSDQMVRLEDENAALKNRVAVLAGRLEATEQALAAAVAYRASEEAAPSGPGGAWPEWFAAHEEIRATLDAALAAARSAGEPA